MSMQFFERPSELPGLEHQDDLLFFVVQDAYQARSCCHNAAA